MLPERINLTKFVATDRDGWPHTWSFWYQRRAGAWFLRDHCGFERRLESTWYYSLPRIRAILENHGLTAQL